MVNGFYETGCATNKVSENLSLIEPNSVVESIVGFVVEVHADLVLKNRVRSF